MAENGSAGARGETQSAGAREDVSLAAVQESQQRAAVKRKISLSGCETCVATEAKYRCPRCMAYSCSLLCVKRHKAESGCNGVRDKTAFTPISHFGEMHLISDYRFLEDTGRLADAATRDQVVHRPTSAKSLNFMKNRARKYNIDLKLLPIGFTKRRENSTYFNKREQQFYWHLKLLFPQSRTEYTEKRVSASKTVGELLRGYIDPGEADPVIQQKLKVYVLAPVNEVRIYMKVENRKHNSARYYRLDSSKSLAENLSHKTVIEYPTLHVVLKVNSLEYRLLNDDNSKEDSQSSADSSSESEEEEGEIRDNL
uniref:box C/D snoRNA protein 1 n=1 Tax=Pristiophorus japonicus TaxID=55135 RepID=UPI00398E9C90